MNNKNLIWQDYRIQWPHHTFIYFDSKLNINHLDELCTLFHAEVEIICDNNNEDYQVIYKNNKLLSINCHIILHFSDVEKVKIQAKNNETGEDIMYGNY